jgi:acid phosphatase type 7
MKMSIKIAVLALLQLLAMCTLADEAPRFDVPLADPTAPLTFVTYGDTRFTQLEGVANALARRALVAKMASENPAAIFIGGDVVYDGSSRADYETYKTETAVWSQARIPIFAALGNHEFRGCAADQSPCLENWWNGAAPSGLRPFRWYSVTVGPKVLVLMLDSDSSLKPASEQRSWLERQIAQADVRVQFILIVLHYPPVRDPIFPRGKDEKEVARYLSKHAQSLHARVVVIGSHVHNYERFRRDDVTYLVSGGGGAKPVPVLRMFGELSKLDTAVNFHYVRFRLENGKLEGTMVRFEPERPAETAWTEPDRFEVDAKDRSKSTRATTPSRN